MPFADGLPFLAFAPSMITLLLLFASFTHPPELLCAVAYVMAQNFTAGYQLHRLVLTNDLLCRHLGLRVNWCSDKPNGTLQSHLLGTPKLSPPPIPQSRCETGIPPSCASVRPDAAYSRVVIFAAPSFCNAATLQY